MSTTPAMNTGTGLLSIQDALKDTLSPAAQVYTRGQDGFEDLTSRWQKYRKPNFALAVAVAVENDVADTVSYTPCAQELIVELSVSLGQIC